jgi:hypothetical protein
VRSFLVCGYELGSGTRVSERDQLQASDWLQDKAERRGTGSAKPVIDVLPLGLLVESPGTSLAGRNRDGHNIEVEKAAFNEALQRGFAPRVGTICDHGKADPKPQLEQI